MRHHTDLSISFKLGRTNNEEFKDYYWNNRDLNIWKKTKMVIG